MTLYNHPSNNNNNNNNNNIHCIKANATRFKNALRRWVPFLAACYVALAVLSIYQTASLSQQLQSIGPNDRDGLPHHHQHHHRHHRHDVNHHHVVNPHLIQRRAPVVPSFPLNQTITTRGTNAARKSTATNTTTATPKKKKQQKKTKQKRKPKTLALLYPPGMIGGYRNQVLRFVSFCWYAQQHNITQLLLPSILWSTQYKAQDSAHYNEFFPIPMEWVFDVNHWNTFSDHLPILVHSMEEKNDDDNNNGEEADCWKPIDQTKLQEDYYYRLVSGTRTTTTSTAITNSTTTTSTSTSFISPLAKILLETIPFLTPLINTTRAVVTGQVRLNPRKIDFYPLVEHCQHPYVYGGGTGAGRLWNDFLAAPKEIPGEEVVTSTTTNNDKNDNDNNNDNMEKAKEMTELMAWISRALQPAPKWQTVADQCVQTSQEYHLGNAATTTTTDHPHQHSPQQRHEHAYIALHARVEMDMMIHKCGRQMEKNLTKLFDMVEEYRLDYNNKNQRRHDHSTEQEPEQEQEQSSSLDGVFVAVSRSGMQQPFPSNNKDTTIQQLAKENIQTLRQRSSTTRLLHLDDTTTAEEKEEASLSSSSSSSQRQKSPSNSSLFFECGELWMQRWHDTHRPRRRRSTTTTNNNNDKNHGDQDQQQQQQQEEEGVPDDYYGSLIPSMMNFYIATQATVFIGVAKSSWSTDVWTTRYYQGKGDTNLEYTSTGIRPVPHGGLPPPHKNC